jgi:prepilin-type N-terminal cleavage/methylation domain-containing protein
MKTNLTATVQRGFTLVEVVTATAISALTMAATIYGYGLTTRRAEWAGYSLAAQSLAMQGLEQARAAKWDPWSSNTNSDLLKSTNFPPQIKTLDLPISGTNVVYATNFWTISTISTNPNLRMIRVDCVWKFRNKGPFTNTTVTYRASDQ